LITRRRHAKKILQFLASKTFIKAFPAPTTPGEKKRRLPFLYRVLSDSKKAQRLISVSMWCLSVDVIAAMRLHMPPHMPPRLPPVLRALLCLPLKLAPIPHRCEQEMNGAAASPAASAPSSKQ
jgi:hypothetical protein